MNLLLEYKKNYTKGGIDTTRQKEVNENLDKYRLNIEAYEKIIEGLRKFAKKTLKEFEN